MKKEIMVLAALIILGGCVNVAIEGQSHLNIINPNLLESPATRISWLEGRKVVIKSSGAGSFYGYCRRASLNAAENFLSARGAQIVYNKESARYLAHVSGWYTRTRDMVSALVKVRIIDLAGKERALKAFGQGEGSYWTYRLYNPDRGVSVACSDAARRAVKNIPAGP